MNSPIVAKAHRKRNPPEKRPAVDSIAAVSPKHEVWDTAKQNATMVEAAYATASDLKPYQERISHCANTLMLKQEFSEEGEEFYKAHAHQCEVRHCPICQRARAFKLRKRFETALQRIKQEYPQGRWVFVTLTVKNPPIAELRSTLKVMNEGFKRMLLLKDFPPIMGFFRGTEVTMGQVEVGLCHPHFHVLFLVPPSYFGKNYVKHEEWVQLWQRGARLDYAPSVDVRAIKDTEGGIDREIIKVAGYSVKPEAMRENPEWFVEYHRQTHHLRFHASGGLVKKLLPSEDDHLDLSPGVAGEEEMQGVEERTGQQILFGFDRPAKRYRRKKAR